MFFLLKVEEDMERVFGELQSMMAAVNLVRETAPGSGEGAGVNTGSGSGGGGIWHPLG